MSPARSMTRSGDYDYFQVVTLNGKDVAMRAEEADGQLREQPAHHLVRVPAEAAVEARTGKVDFGVYDPTFYTAIDFIDDDHMAVDGTCLPPARAPSSGPIPTRRSAQNQATLTDAVLQRSERHRHEQDFRDEARAHLPGLISRGQSMNKTFVRIRLRPAARQLRALTCFWPRACQSSLGIGTNEAVLPSTGYFSG
jgi:hypothetical protein